MQKSKDPFNLGRFLTAQQNMYPTVLAELKAGQKRTHWMWFIFPQFAGLGSSEMSRLYAIHTLAEASAYLRHPILGERLRECANTLLSLRGFSAQQIFSSPDDAKLCSSMTLFTQVAGRGSEFEQVLARYFEGRQDGRTLELLKETNQSAGEDEHQ